MNRILYRDLQPEGWLKRQLEIQAEGLAGNLDRVWPDVRDSAWIGGDREGWERVPYWLDGFIPLACLLRDEDLTARARRYMNAIMDRQQEDGWICPCSQEERKGYDLWAVLLIGKVLAVYASCMEDERAERSLYRTMKNLHDLLASGTVRLENWGRFRWFEGLIPLLHLMDRCPEQWMTELGELLLAQGADYPSFMERWKRPLNEWTYETHIVNIAMMLKYEALLSLVQNRPMNGTPERLWQFLTEYNGTAVGTLTGDECLSGLGNQQGTELCAVVEMMYSFEWLYSVSGDSVWADRLEKAAFNALPATFTEDMWAHQYDQMVNQVSCVPFPGKSFFRTNGPTTAAAQPTWARDGRNSRCVRSRRPMRDSCSRISCPAACIQTSADSPCFSGSTASIPSALALTSRCRQRMRILRCPSASPSGPGRCWSMENLCTLRRAT